MIVKVAQFFSLPYWSLQCDRSIKLIQKCILLFHSESEPNCNLLWPLELGRGDDVPGLRLDLET